MNIFVLFLPIIRDHLADGARFLKAINCFTSSAGATIQPLISISSGLQNVRSMFSNDGGKLVVRNFHDIVES